MPTIMKRLFSTPPAKEPFSRPHSYGGWHRMTESGRLITEARKLKSRRIGSDPTSWLQFTLEILALASVVVLAASLALWLSLSGSSSKHADTAFCVMFWAFLVLCGLSAVLTIFHLFRRS